MYSGSARMYVGGVSLWGMSSWCWRQCEGGCMLEVSIHVRLRVNVSVHDGLSWGCLYMSGMMALSVQEHVLEVVCINVCGMGSSMF